MARSTIEFNEAADEQLQYLTRELGVKSKAEIVRNALSLYSYLVGELTNPDRHLALGIIAKDRDNQVEQVIVVPGISGVAESKKRIAV
jgi:hypothetical protein